MELTTVGILSIFLLLLFIAAGLEIGVSFLIIGTISISLVLATPQALNLLGESLYYSINTPGYIALPMFVLMGAFAARGGFAKNAYRGLHIVSAGLPGSLAIATCFSCAAFGAISGSSLATATIFGKLALPEMERYKYDKSLALGSIAAAGTFAGMIPPSILFIVYCIFTDQSIGEMFAAGIIPGLITAVVYAASIYYRVKKNPKLAPEILEEKDVTLKQRINALKLTGPIALLALIVLGGIYGGLFTPTEAAAVGTIIAFIMGIIMGDLGKLKSIKESLRESARTTSMVFIIIVGAMFFSRSLAITRIPTTITRFIIGLDVPSIFILIGILIVWFFLGMIIIPSAIYALTIPIVFPIIMSLGYDPIWFGVITYKLAEIAAVTPPIGLNVYALKGVAGKDTSLEDVFTGIWPFVLCDIGVLILLIMFPKIVTFLPDLLLGK